MKMIDSFAHLNHTKTTVYMPSGKFVDLEKMTPDDVCWKDIVTCLSNINRWGGSMRWSVASHSYFCACLADSHFMENYLQNHSPKKRSTRQVENYKSQLKTHMLLHDAHESYIGDIITPVTDLVPGMKDALFKVKSDIDAVIYKHLDLKLPDEETRHIIKMLDKRAFAIERRYLIKLTAKNYDFFKLLLAGGDEQTDVFDVVYKNFDCESANFMCEEMFADQIKLRFCEESLRGQI